MKSRPFAYVCAPHDTNREFPSHRLQEYCRALYKLGYYPQAPNMSLSKILNENDPVEREDRKRMAQSMIPRCRVLVVCGEEMTEEMETEILLAKRFHVVATTLAGIKKISLSSKEKLQS